MDELLVVPKDRERPNTWLLCSVIALTVLALYMSLTDLHPHRQPQHPPVGAAQR